MISLLGTFDDFLFFFLAVYGLFPWRVKLVCFQNSRCGDVFSSARDGSRPISTPGESRTERPQGVTILETLPKRSQVTATTTAARAIPVKKEEGIPWERIESTSKPGHYYYFNPITGALSVIFHWFWWI